MAPKQIPSWHWCCPPWAGITSVETSRVMRLCPTPKSSDAHIDERGMRSLMWTPLAVRPPLTIWSAIFMQFCRHRGIDWRVKAEALGQLGMSGRTESRHRFLAKFNLSKSGWESEDLDALIKRTGDKGDRKRLGVFKNDERTKRTRQKRLRRCDCWHDRIWKGKYSHSSLR